MRRLEFERAIASEDDEPVSAKIRKLIADEACNLDPSYTGPMLEETPNGFRPNETFIKGMLEWFKEGKTLPKRWVYEIVLGCYGYLAQEPSLTECTIPEGESVDVCVGSSSRFRIAMPCVARLT